MGAPKNLKHKQPTFLDASSSDRKSLFVFFVVSLVVHLAVFMGILIFQDVHAPKPLPPVIQVDLVSFSQVPEVESSAVSEEEKGKDIGIASAPSEPKPQKIKHIKPDISLKTKPKNLKTLMQAQKKQEKIEKEKQETQKITDKKSKPEEKFTKVKTEEKEQQSEEQISEALNRLQKKVASQTSTQKTQKNGTSGSRTHKGVDPLTLYHMVIQSAIQQNWVYSDVLAGVDKNLQAVVIIKVLPSGEIRDIFFETRSGNRYLDESAKKAILKINPLPPLPINRPSYDMGLIFTPKGVR